MAINADEDTEFNDALRKHGILPPKPEAPRTPSPPLSPTLEELLQDFEPDQIRERAEEARNDDEARAIEAYRRKRIAEIQQEQRRARFGRVYPIGRDDYTREVTEASKIDEEGEEMVNKGTGVVCFLYKDGHVPSERAFNYIRTLASRHPRTKFVSIVGDKCIPNYPDRHLPTFFIYRKGEIVNQQVAWGADRERGLEELEALLNVAENDEDNDLSDDAYGEFSRSSVAKANIGAPKNIRDSARENDDSDSDFDL
ncbi:thioredoxin-like protein [Sanghuangporus baumii]|uniref:Thioredoxin-like protein n=1 Tax=Sanghuangporus baumii TaxID=108892 RepID=A0A9Q5HV36_SANBA|nr:thioredoxin-like protein [Sanghuangporus baumii]